MVITVKWNPAYTAKTTKSTCELIFGEVGFNMESLNKHKRTGTCAFIHRAVY